MISLRDYQEEWIVALKHAMRSHRRVLGVMPTGSGKTVCFASIAHGAMRKLRRVLILVHRGLILDQISAALEALDVPHGRISPGWPPSTHPVQIGMIQTVARRIDHYPAPDLIITDEAHHCVGPTYERVLAAYPAAYIVGVTATPERLDGRGLGTQFETMVLGPEIPDLIARGYLADYEYFAPPLVADLSNVPIVAGDYARSALVDAMDKPKITGSAVEHYTRYAPGRPGVWFCTSVAHSEHVAGEFKAAGYSAASIDGTMSDVERRRRLTGLADGSLQVLTSCDLIGEGVDVPAVSVIGHLRPTRSLAMHKQFEGRGLRLKSDGSKAIIFDHVGNSAKHGRPRTVHPWTLDGRRRKPALEKIKQCLACYRVFGDGEPITCVDPQRGCLARESDAAPNLGREVEEVAGELVQVSDRPAWAGGISLVEARGQDYFDIVRRARTVDQLQEISRARGYKRGWVKHILEGRANR